MNEMKALERTVCLPRSTCSWLHKRRVVALGGGTGLPAVLRSLKKRLFPPSSSSYEGECDRERLIGIVTVTDDGGSSGRLRRELDILPPGDIRNCLAALSDNSDVFSDLFQYRFGKGDGLSGHSLGNLLLAALTDLKGNFMEAIQYFGRIMNVSGQIFPLSSMNVTLAARFTDGSVVRGESAIIERRGKIRDVFLSPSYAKSYPEALEAIGCADSIIIGPGSLYTSIIPNLLVNDIATAIMKSKAKKIYICNLMTEPGETACYTATDHIKAILDHTEYGLLQYVILNNGRVSKEVLRRYTEQGCDPVHYNIEEIRSLGITSIVADVVTEEGDTIRHDDDKLGRLLMEVM